MGIKVLLEKEKKIYKLKRIDTGGIFGRGKPKEREIEGTLPELIKYFGYTLSKGNSYDKKISTNPKTINSLISNVNKAFDASTGNGYSGISVELVN